MKIESTISIRKHATKNYLILDILVFPLYCSNCHSSLNELYHHTASRYGLVGRVKCPICDSEILLLDDDNIVERIYMGVPNPTIFYHMNNKKELNDTIEFRELYHLNDTVIQQIEALTKQDIWSLIPEKMIPLTTLIDTLQNLLSISITKQYQYITDKRFTVLPEIINHWIELLEIIGLSNLYLQKSSI